MRQLASELIITIEKDQIAARNVGGTAMPSGLVASLTRSQLQDLIRYLSQLGKVK